MRAFNEFKNEDRTFWAFVKYISESLGYTVRKENIVKEYELKEIVELFEEERISYDPAMVNRAINYLNKRAKVLNDIVSKNLMDAKQAEVEFNRLKQVYDENGYNSKLPMNKQSGEMKKINFFTAIINILTEDTLKKIKSPISGEFFVDDPRELVYIIDSDNMIVSSTSRRYDGVYPGTHNPLIVWEIKEYYYATTFGSRIADGVYETQLDGYEFEEIERETGRHIEHVFLVDGYKTWWEDGKSYLCRVIDALNKGLVDEVIIGREVLTRWPQLLKEIIEQ